MKYLSTNNCSASLDNQNYISLSFDYDKFTILKILENVPASNLVTACNKIMVEKISILLGSKLPIHTILYFQLQPTVSSLIHIDKNLKDPRAFQSMFALNLPLANSDKVSMNWYSKNSPDVDVSEFTGPNGSATASISKDEATCIDRAYYTNPHIVKIHDWHSVENQSITDVAYFISLRFFQPLDRVLSSFGQSFKIL
jgi:hypothetical protein